ncbi:MAG: hypothetical protein KA436_07510 [Oligoflexales bacterium]|nr:hypothetical protein [Oligoflexales bacterium]
MKFVKKIIAVKLIVLSVIILTKLGLVFFGEENTFAVEKEEKKENAGKDGQEIKVDKEGKEKEIKNKDEAKDLSQEEKKPESVVKSDGEEVALENAPAPKEAAEKSLQDQVRDYLSDLIHLPSLDIQKAQKEELERYRTAAQKTKREIDQKMEDLKKKVTFFKEVERNLEKKLKSLQEERDFFVKTVQKEKMLSDERLAELTEVYAKMEPKKAAPIIEKMDKDLVVRFFKTLSKKQTTRILESMSPESALQITEYFGRVGSAREYDLLKELNVSLSESFKDCKASTPVAHE